jgi:hypothetical protein
MRTLMANGIPTMSRRLRSMLGNVPDRVPAMAVVAPSKTLNASGAAGRLHTILALRLRPPRPVARRTGEIVVRELGGFKAQVMPFRRT